MATSQIRNLIVGYFRRRNKLSLRKQGTFLSRLGEMLENGFSLSEGIDFLRRLNRKDQAMYQSILNRLQTGAPLYEVLNEHHFDPKACMQIYFAEKHSYLASSLQASGGYLLKREQDKKKLLKLLHYPFILIIALFLVMILLNHFLLPRFEHLYQSMVYEPNYSTRFLMHFMQFTPLYLLLFIFIGLSLLFIFIFYQRHQTALQKATTFSQLPFLGFLYKLYTSQFLAREWSFLLKSGFSISDILHVMSFQSFRPLFREAAENMRENLKAGRSFSDALASFSFVEQELVTIIRHGEKSGNLSKELAYYSHFCLQKMEGKIEKTFILVQPMIFIFIGILIVLIYMAILLPMFQMLESI